MEISFKLISDCILLIRENPRLPGDLWESRGRRRGCVYTLDKRLFSVKQVWQ